MLGNMHTDRNDDLEPIPHRVLDELGAIEYRTGTKDHDDTWTMFTAAAPYIAMDGYTQGRVSFVDVAGDGLYARYEVLAPVRPVDEDNPRMHWAEVSEWPVSATDPRGTVRTIWRLLEEHAV